MLTSTVCQYAHCPRVLESIIKSQAAKAGVALGADTKVIVDGNTRFLGFFQARHLSTRGPTLTKSDYQPPSATEIATTVSADCSSEEAAVNRSRLQAIRQVEQGSSVSRPLSLRDRPLSSEKAALVNVATLKLAITYATQVARRSPVFANRASDIVADVAIDALREAAQRFDSSRKTASGKPVQFEPYLKAIVGQRVPRALTDYFGAAGSKKTRSAMVDVHELNPPSGECSPLAMLVAADTVCS